MNEAIAPLKPRVLMLDTCIWVNSQIGTNSGHEAARKLIVEARKQGARVGIAPHSLSNVFYIVHRYLRRLDATTGAIPSERSTAAAKEAAWGIVNGIMEYAEVVGSDGSDARLAALHKSVHDDFEDDLVIAAARRMRADLIVSDDLAFVKHCPLPAMTAEDALRWIIA
jgi:predicted nucleic acid-binding protein